MNDNKDYNRLLNERYVPAASTDLSRRIIRAAAEKRQNIPLYQRIMEEIYMMLYIPQPAYAFAFVLAIGIIIGFQVTADDSLISSEDFFSFTQLEQEEWL
jgi:hypothetical protein